jgi:hypothetical protein
MNVAALHFDGRALNWFCPGCKFRHGVPVKQGPRGQVAWKFNGSLTTPTLEPSILVFPRQRFIDKDLPYGTEPGQLLRDENRETTPRCHSFVRQGKLQFLDDCEHELAGQTVDMVEWIPVPRDGRP